MRINKHKCQAAIRWLFWLADHIRNRFESAQYVWEAMDGKIPYSWRKLSKYFGFKEVKYKGWTRWAKFR